MNHLLNQDPVLKIKCYFSLVDICDESETDDDVDMVDQDETFLKCSTFQENNGDKTQDTEQKWK